MRAPRRPFLSRKLAYEAVGVLAGRGDRQQVFGVEPRDDIGQHGDVVHRARHRAARSCVNDVMT